ncbi:MAG: hypothetical protein M3135_01425 [Actinomycetota bacterium]|nr:hypothetical protein [Actinomycetota bacterium]
MFFCVVGFIAIGFGWNGMAKVACPDCQLPYLLSGGATGIGLILLGTGLLVMAQIRDERAKLGDQLHEVATAVSKAVSAAGGNVPGNLVVAGRSTYHRPDCRLVEGKADADLVAVEVARLQGLSPCRVCSPPAIEDGSVAAPAETPSRPAKKTPAKAAGRR